MSLSALYIWLGVSTLFVIVGVVLEGQEIWSEIKETGLKNLKHVWAKIGFALLVVGLCGELFFQTKIESADAELKRQSDIKIATAQTEAATANEHAGNAIERASSLEKDAAQLKAANLALETKLAPRRLTAEKQANIGKSLAWFSGKTVRFESYGLDAEAAILGKQIEDAFNLADIKIDDSLMTRTSGGSIEFGVRVLGTDNDLVSSIRKALADAGIKTSSVAPFPNGGASFGASAPTVPPDAAVFIGVKPITE